MSTLTTGICDLFVVVQPFLTFDNRLGLLGFPQGSEAESQGALNLGLKDQLTALEWVQNNIHVFGGDKDRVSLVDSTQITSAFV